MIVKCEQCQTRFKIPDDRVTDKGVKVRCTKCQHMFRVTRDMAQPSAAAAPPAPSVAPRPPPNPSPSYPPKSFVGSPYPSPQRAPAFGLASPPEADPFAAFGVVASEPSSHDETRPGVFALGVEASRVPDLRLSAPPEPIHTAPPSSAKPFDFGSLSPTAPATAAKPKLPTAKSPVAPPPTAVPAGGSPFDFSAMPAPEAPLAQAPAPSSPFDFSSLGPSDDAVPAPAPPGAGMSFDFGSLGPSEAAPPSFDFGAMSPAVPSSPAATTKVAALEPSSASSLFADVPDLPAEGAPATDDFFGTPLDPPASAPAASKPGSYRSGAGSREELFEMPAAQLAGLMPVEPEAPRIQPGNTPIEQQLISLGSGVRSSPSGLARVAAVEKQRRSALGLVVNLGIAVVLVSGLVVVGSAWLNDGKLDSSAFTAARLKSLVSRDTTFEAKDISNGLYDTLRGKPVFYVRGEVANHGTSATRVRVRAEILDSDRLVRAAEVVAGSPPTPEQLRNVTGADDVERLLETTSKTAPSVAPGQSAPFLVTFFEYPPDLKAFRVRVSVRAEGGETVERE